MDLHIDHPEAIPLAQIVKWDLLKGLDLQPTLFYAPMVSSGPSVIPMRSILCFRAVTYLSDVQ